MNTEMSALKQRPKLARWAFERDLRAPDIAPRLGVSEVQVRNYMRRFDDPKRIVPRPKVIEKIVELTLGEIGAADFYPPELSARPGDAVVLTAGRGE